MHEWAGWDGMDIQMNGWLNQQKQKPRMVGSVQWQAGKNACHMSMGKEKDKKGQKKAEKKIRH